MMRGLILTAFSVLMAVVLTLVGLRFLALLLDANRDSQLVHDLYRYSEFWVKPFFNVFGWKNQAAAGGGTFEPASLLAFVVYLVIGAFVESILTGGVYSRWRTTAAE
jgi:hypothetical protein